MAHRFLATLLALAFALGVSTKADAAATVRVVEAWPAGDRVMLAPDQRLHLRLAYTTDEPIGIWLSPYFRGKPARAGTSPSPRYSGSGETAAWLFLLAPEAEVDEIRITAGDGGPGTTPVVAIHRVHVVHGQGASGTDTPPTWVPELDERARALMEAQFQAAPNAPMGAIDMLLFAGLMLALPIAPVLGFVAPVMAYRRWRGGWRIAAAVPGIMMAFVVLRIAVGVAIDPTSHNLWPFETLLAGAVSVAAIVSLVVLRKLTGAANDA